MVLAGFWARAGAFLIDSLVQIPLILVAISLLVSGIAPLMTGDGAAGAFGGLLLVLGSLAYLAAMAVGICFRPEMMVRRGRTPGQRMLGIRVVDARTGLPLSRGRAYGRHLMALFVSGQVCYLGFLWMLWDGQRRTFHDMVVTSYVIVDRTP